MKNVEDIIKNPLEPLNSNNENLKKYDGYY